ncbi:MAG: metallophosphoesterase family protein [Akkermansiaceae bacterium]|nr:metallophosphoesterase family protein [Akkermansiaceae bacterium]
MRTRIISDLHLGHTASRLKSVAMLDPVLDGVDHLILAGDVWQQQKVGVGFANAESLFEELLSVAKKRGILVEILRGNHDPDSGKGVVWLADRAVLVTHGDAIYDDATPWSREIGKYREEINLIIQKYAPQSHCAEACAERAREIALTLKAISLPNLPSPFDFLVTALWPLSRSFEMLRVWRGMGSQGLRFLNHSGKGACVLICGHFHQSGIWEKEGKVMINTGAFMQGSKPWAVDVNEEKLTARELVFGDGSFHLGEVKGRWILRG